MDSDTFVKFAQQRIAPEDGSGVKESLLHLVNTERRKIRLTSCIHDCRLGCPFCNVLLDVPVIDEQDASCDAECVG